MSQNKSTRTKCEKKQKYRDLKMGFAKINYKLFEDEEGVETVAVRGL